MPNLEDVKTALKGQENADELCQALEQAILHERNTGKGLVNDVKSKHDKLSKALESLGYGGNGDLEQFITDTKGKLENGNKATSKLTKEQQRLADMEGKLQDVLAKLSHAEEKAQKSEGSGSSSIEGNVGEF